MSNLQTLEELIENGIIEMGRGEVISKEDIKKTKGSYPIYSSSVQNEGLFGTYGKYMFDEELVSWSVDGGGDVFYRPKHKFSITNVSGYIRVLRKDLLDVKYLALSMMKQKLKYSFDYAFKAHPSVIAPMYSVNLVDIGEQKRIAGILANVDDNIRIVEEEIKQLNSIKQGTLKNLLTKGLKKQEFKDTELGLIPQDWEIMRIDQVCNILDNKRKPLNSEERAKIKGSIPYYGANNIQGYVNDYIFNEDLVLLAEDGGSFNEYETKPISYRIKGKSWVNNHAHVLQPKPGIIINDFVFFSTVHKNIMSYIVGGGRSKLNKSDLESIQIFVPKIKEQEDICKILNNIESNIFLKIEELQRISILKFGLLSILV